MADRARNESADVFQPAKVESLGLRHLTLELSERCQNACPHCYINQAVDAPCRARELDTTAWQDIVSQAAALGTLSLHLTGGDPLVREDFPILYEFIRRQGMVVQLSTNARSITAELADLFARIPPKKRIKITVYGMSRASYEAVSGIHGSYDEFQQGIARLRERGIPFGVTFVALPANQHELEEFKAWSATLPDMTSAAQITTHLDLRVRRDDLARDRRIAALRMSPETRVALLRRASGYEQEMRSFCRFIGASGTCIFDCGALKGGVIDAYGFLLPCLSVRHPAVTVDVRVTSLREAVLTLRARLREVRAEDPAYLARCAGCFLHGLCEMCPGKAWTEHGTLDTPVQYFCNLAHAQARDIGLLRADEYAWDVTDGPARVAAFMKEDSDVEHSA